MKKRCSNPNENQYEIYGGRGIRVCERWATFENFLADMGERPTRNHSIDRIDTDGHYEPGNCRWANRREQQGNRRFCYRIHHNGEVFNLASLARKLGMRRKTLRSRIIARGITQKEFDSAILM